MVLRAMRFLRSILAAAFVAATVSPALSAPDGRRKVSAVSWTSFITEMAPRTGAPKRGKVGKAGMPPAPASPQGAKGQAGPDGTPNGASKSTFKSTSKGTSKGTSKSSPNPPPGKITCQVERICQDIKRPVREVVTACAMVKPSSDSPPRRLCTEKVASGERAGPQLCRSAKICKVRQDVNASR
ncbi:hypothetical protein [Chelatococcus asaccharovorans]|nr:hypothetical protein [Chelatococcus asaccharovorans]MBS7702352.1 hypothetical protein [Chelatococcus asaccharovorans]